MKRKLFLFFLIVLFGFAVSVNFVGCKKDKAKDTSSIEENSEDEDMSSDDEEDAE